jgi:hypothetical protein
MERTRFLWWTRPHLLLLFVIIPTYVVLVVAPLVPRYGKYYLTLEYALLGLAFLSLLCASAYVASTYRIGHTNSSRCDPPPLVMDVVAVLTVMAYMLWFWRLAVEPELLLQVLAGTTLHVRGEISTIPGLTTLSQMGIVYSTFWSLKRWVWRSTLPRRCTVYQWIILLLSILRTIAWGERLATIEVVLPMVLIYLASRRPRSPRGRWLLALLPLLCLVGVVVFFGVTELFRSWGKQHAGSEGAAAYMLDRFVYYYFSSLNNGCGLLQEFPWPQWDMQFTLKWIYTLPGLGSWITTTLHPSDAEALFLRTYADMEFTTFSGIFAVFYDWGVAGGLTIAVGLGTTMGLVYRQFQRGYGLGLWIYPLLYVHLLEILRIFYLGYSRTIPALLGFAVIYMVCKLSRSRGMQTN